MKGKYAAAALLYLLFPAALFAEHLELRDPEPVSTIVAILQMQYGVVASSEEADVTRIAATKQVAVDFQTNSLNLPAGVVQKYQPNAFELDPPDPVRQPA